MHCYEHWSRGRSIGGSRFRPRGTLGDSEPLATALKEMMDDPEKAKSYGVAARNRMKEFSRQREYQAWKQVYHELIEF